MDKGNCAFGSFCFFVCFKLLNDFLYTFKFMSFFFYYIFFTIFSNQFCWYLRELPLDISLVTTSLIDFASFNHASTDSLGLCGCITLIHKY